MKNKFVLFVISLGFLAVVIVAVNIINPLRLWERRNDNIRINDLKSIASALASYYKNYGQYPPANPKEYIIVFNKGFGTDNVYWGTPWEPYMKLVPRDPTPKRRYVYWSEVTDNYQSFRLYASLEDPGSVPQACSMGQDCPFVPGKNLCGNNIPCNYGITSLNVSP